MVVLYIVCALALLVLIAAYVVFRIVLHSPNRMQNDDFYMAPSEQTDALREQINDMIRALNQIPYERVFITSFDGLKLSGRYYHQTDGAPLAILMHGYRGTPSRDFSGGAQSYLAAGFNLLIVEQRAHCSSEGHVITFGVNEHRDCLSWIDYARARFGERVRIVLCGISMGASTVLMACGTDLPKNVKGVVADCPFTAPKEIIFKVCRDLKLPPRLIWPLLRLGARLYGGFDPTGVDASDAVKRSPVPILLIHGEDDRFVPCDMGRRIAAANPERIELHTFPHAGHGLSFLIDRPRYERITRAFFARILAQDAERA